jgi:hypothetical protein
MGQVFFSCLVDFPCTSSIRIILTISQPKKKKYGNEIQHQYPTYPFPEVWMIGSSGWDFAGKFIVSIAGKTGVFVQTKKYWLFSHFCKNSYLIENTILPFCFSKTRRHLPFRV